ncbi:MAG: hypothetical protein AAFY45_10250 [Bacteroidota bacterium]
MKSSEGFAKTQERFEEALDLLLEKLQADKNVLAVIVAGSLSYDVVWEKSDIDLMIIIRDGKLKGQDKEVALTEYDVNIHAWALERSRFRKIMEGSLRNSFLHSYFSKSRLLFTRDESIRDLYEGVEKLGSRDKQSQMLSTASSFMPLISKVEKFLYSKKDPQYAFIWITYMYSGLARIELNMADEIVSREVVHQAIKINPAFFKAIYTDLIDAPKDKAAIEKALYLIDNFLVERCKDIFQPLLDFLSDGGRIKSATEIDTWAQQQMNISDLVGACEWLADKEIIHRTSLPHRLTPTSPEEVEELAFYY